MNLGKLKDLEAKATPGEWLDIRGMGNLLNGERIQDVLVDYKGEKQHRGDDGISSRFFTENEHTKMLVIALRNSAKEMISTIERYKAALEAIELDEDEDGPGLEYYTLQRLATEALKDPEKTGANL